VFWYFSPSLRGITPDGLCVMGEFPYRVSAFYTNRFSLGEVGHAGQWVD